MKIKTNDSIVKLTQREKEILLLIVNEYTTKEIASRLSLSADTIKSHRATIMNKLKVRNVAGMVRVACYQNLLTTYDN